MTLTWTLMLLPAAAVAAGANAQQEQEEAGKHTRRGVEGGVLAGKLT